MSKINRQGVVGVSNNRADAYYSTARPCDSHDFWRWGSDNHLPDALALMSRQSTVHRRIINDKADYISGRGFTYDENEPLLAAFVERANGNGESLRQMLNKVAFDKALFGNAFVEVVTNADGSMLAMYHHDALTCRLAKQSPRVLLHHDWSNYSPSEARSLPLYPAFEEQEDGTLRSMLHYKDYEPGFSHYGVPPYIAGMNVSAIAYKTDRWNIARLENSFQMSGVMILDDVAMTEAEADHIIAEAERRFAGNPGQVLFVVRGGSENDNSRFVPFTQQSDGDWRDLHEQATNDIVVAHSWFRSLSGLDYTSDFNAERILHEYEVALNTIIQTEQAELLEPIVEILGSRLGCNASSLSFINRPPTRSKPIYMRVWEARKADGLPYDENDAEQQLFLSQITKYNVTSIG